VALLADDFQASAPIGLQQTFLVLHYRLAMAAINVLGCRGESPLQNSGENLFRQMVNQLADCVERLGAMRATGSDYAVELIVEGVEIMLTEFGLRVSKD